MIWRIPVFLLSFLFLIACDQKNTTRSQSVAPTKDSVLVWVDWARNKTALPMESRKSFLKKALSTIKKIPNNSSKTQLLSDISLVANYELKDSVLFKKTNRQLMLLARKISDHKAHGEAHWDLGSYYNRKNIPDSAYYHYKEAYQLFAGSSPDSIPKEYAPRMLLNMARIQDGVKDHIGAEKKIIQAIKLLKENDVQKRLFDAYNDLATTQTGLNKFDRAIDYYKKAGEYVFYGPKAKQYENKVLNANNIASVYLRKKDFPKAAELYTKALEIDNFFHRETELFAKATASGAYSDFKSGNQNFESVKDRLGESLSIYDSINEKYGMARVLHFNAEVLQAENNINGAIIEALKAKEIAETTENNDRLLETLKLLTELDEVNGAQYANQYFALTEKLQNEERAIQDKFARIEMETDEVIEKNESLAKQKEWLIGITLGLLVLGVAIFTIIAQHISNQKLKFKQKQQESNQEIYNLMLAQQGKLEEGKKSEQKRISEELHDSILGQMLGIRLIMSGLNERGDTAAVTQRAELIDKMQGVEEEIRVISHELNHSAYQKIHNFIEAIKDLIDSVSSSAKIKSSFSFDQEFDWDSLDGDVKINSYRIVQESLQNCVKHARCKHISVTFDVDDKMLTLTIVDDGVGFDIKKGKKGIGLKNVISRVKKVNGKLKINSIADEGTTVTVTIERKNDGVPNLKPKTERTTSIENIA